jgi:predicted homoserine dehydrogenase-like protein
MVVNVNTQLPFAVVRVAVQVSPVLAVTLTEPVGVPALATAKLTVTPCETTDGFGVFAVMAVLLLAFVAATVCIADAGM